MGWSLEWGPREKFLTDISGEIPEAPLLEKPSLDEIEQHYWRIFHELSASRATGFSMGAVPISEILAYCQLYGIDSIEERSDLVYIIAEMDTEFIGFFGSKKKGM